MDRRILLKGLFGVAGAGALAVVLPPEAEALPGLPPAPGDPKSGSNVLPNLEELQAGPEDGEAPEEGVQLAQYYYRRRRRRRRRWRWRNYCRRWWNGYRYRRRCRRRRVWYWSWY